MRAFRLGWLYFKLGSLTELQYRANFFIQLLQSAVAAGTAIVVLKLVYSHTTELNGWSEAELLVVMGIQILLGGVIRMSIQPNMERLIHDVRQGTLDYVLTKPDDGQVLAVDGKVTLDDNAAFRQEHARFADTSNTDPIEARAIAKHLNYVKLDGEVGIIGNGAGLVMSTLDVVAYAGENHGNVKPANFLDIGGGASAEVMAAGLDVILGDPQVKSVFVNVFGGITACDAVAKGIVGALAELGHSANKPLVVRLDGNNADLGRQILLDAANPLVELVENRDYAGSSHLFFDLGNQTLLGFFDFPGLGLQPGVESIGSVQHIAISAPRDRWEEVRDKLDAAGVKYAGPDLGIEESMYFKDPDGIQIELLSDPLMYFGGKQLDE